MVQKGSLAMSNLALAFEASTGTYGSRVQIAPGIQFRPDQFLCQTLVNVGTPESVCSMLTDLLKPLLPATAGTAAPLPTTTDVLPEPAVGSKTPPAGTQSGLPALLGLLGGGS